MKDLRTIEFTKNGFTFTVDYNKVTYQLDEPIQDTEPQYECTYDILKVVKFDENGDEFKSTELELEEIDKEVEKDCYS